MITSAEAVKFSNESIRPTAEQMRGLYWKCKATLSAWYSGKSALFPNSAEEVLEDGRAATGATVLTGADINSLLAQGAAFVTACEQAGVVDVINKPCVRALGID